LSTEQGPTEEQIRELEEQIKKLRVEDVLLQTLVTLVNMGGRKLVGEEKDLEQGKLAIEAVRALLPLCPEDQVGPIREALSQLQMVFVRESQEPEAGREGEQPKASPEDAERAKARSKIWTPPGT
jgi:hypothetical protein